jgi:vancomycin resistance protein YoaR
VEFSATQLGKALQSRVASPDEIALTLDFRVLDEALVSARAALERAAVDARFVVAKDDSISIEPSLTARKISTQEVHTTVWAAAQTPERRALLPVIEIDEAKLSTERAQSLGITEKVATFVTHFMCCQPRVKNIERMANLLHGTVMLPGETLSVNERVGPRNKASGFVAGPTIVEGEIEDTYGGGVSQFATTLFNAVLNGGYQIIERQAHSYYFPRYPLGHEATLSFPKPDLIFKNDTRYGLLIQARYTSTSIRITLYGNNEGRRIERKLSHAFDFQDPPVDYVPDDTLEPDDEEKVVERGSRGFSVIATRIVTAADGRRQEEARKVVYKPRERVVRVHPCLIPKEDDDHTGDKCPEPEEAEEEATEGTGGAPSSPSENE